MRTLLFIPLKYMFKLLRIPLVFALYCVASPLLLARTILRFVNKKLGTILAKHQNGIVELLWKAFAPTSWRTYAKGEKIGGLWRRGTEIHKQVKLEEKEAKDILKRKSK